MPQAKLQSFTLKPGTVTGRVRDAIAGCTDRPGPRRHDTVAP